MDNFGLSLGYQCNKERTSYSTQDGKKATHAWESIEQLKIKNGGRNLELYLEIRDQFSKYIMDFRHESGCLEFLQLPSSSILLFSKQSTVVFPNKSADIYKVIQRWLKETKGILFRLGFFGF